MRPARREAIAVVAAGVKAPGGLTVEELWTSVCSARATAEPYLDDRLPPDARLLVCRVHGFEPGPYFSLVERRRFDRAHQLALAAAQDAMTACDGDRPPAERCAIVCGVGLGAAATQEDQHNNLAAHGVRGVSPVAIPMMMPNAMASLLSLRFGFRGPCVTVSTACASGATAIAEGVELLRRDAADLVLAGGGDSLVTYSALAGFLRLDVMSRNIAHPEFASRPFDRDRDGFVMGEGAGFVLLQRASDASRMGRRVLGFVSGSASTADAHHLVAPSPDGVGALTCMRLALEDAGVTPAEVSHVNAHGTSTVAGDLSEAIALSALFPSGGPPVAAVKGTTGHLVGGSGAVEAIIALRSLETGLVPPVAGLGHVDPKIAIDLVQSGPRQIRPGPALSNSFGFGGLNTALVLGPA